MRCSIFTATRIAEGIKATPISFSLLILSVIFYFVFEIRAQAIAGDIPLGCGTSVISFLQPWGDRYEPSFESWRDHFDSHKKAGVDTIVLQWSNWGPDAEQSAQLPLWFDPAVKAAKKTGISLWVGLSYDPEFGPALHGSNSVFYIKRRIKRSSELVNRLEPYFSDPRFQDVIKGVYISDEVDADWLLSSNSKELLFDYYKDVSDYAKRQLNTSVSLSTYATDAASNREYIQELKALTKEAGIDKIFKQQALGAGFQSKESAIHLLDILSKDEPELSKKVVSVVEFFNTAKSGGFSSVSTSEAIQRITINQSHSKLAMFSLANYVIDVPESKKILLQLEARRKFCTSLR